VIKADKLLFLIAMFYFVFYILSLHSISVNSLQEIFIVLYNKIL